MAGATDAHTEAPFLAKLLSVTTAPGGVWEPDDLRDMLEHLLRTRLDPDSSDRFNAFDPPLPPPPATGMTFGELLTDSAPPMAALEWVKQFAKRCRLDPDSALPPEIAMVLYLACIVAARLLCGATITRMPDPELGQALGWALSQSWVDESTRALLGEGVRAVQAATPAKLDKRAGGETDAIR